MSGVLEAVQLALVAALRGHPPLMALAMGVFDGPPRRASFPYVEIGEIVAADWGTKTHPGFELRVPVLVRDDLEHGARRFDLLDRVADAIETLPAAFGGWRVASLVFGRARGARGADGWTGLVEFRLRVMGE